MSESPTSGPSAHSSPSEFTPPARRKLSMQRPSTTGLALQSGAKCWAPHGGEAFVEAVVDGVLPNGKVRVRLSRRSSQSSPEGRHHQHLECSANELLPRSLERSCMANMDELPELNMAEVLANVRELYGRRQPASPKEGGWSAIYSSVGPVLIAMNPFEELPLYGPEWIRTFREAGNQGYLTRERGTLGPHCFGTVEEAYQGLRTQQHQSVIICGESGAGKTVTNRKMLEYLLDAESLEQLGGLERKGRARTSTCSTGRGRASTNCLGGELPVPPMLRRASSSCVYGVEKSMIAGANELLEAFGNAQTVRNDNSSRFGKYSQLHFDGEALAIRGFEIEHYLLERSRVTAQPAGERNYHIFYLLMESTSAAEYGLVGGPEAFRYTSGIKAANSGAMRGSVAGGFLCCQDGAFEAVRSRMEASGLSPEDCDLAFEAIAAVLHLGNVDFEELQGQARVTPSTSGSLSRACELLGLGAEGADGLGEALTVLRTSRFPKNLSVAASRAQRDAVAKMVYSRLFDWLIGRLNEKLMRWRGGKRATLGLLDIFGFEDMPSNGLEQLFINLTNERIQFIFNDVMFEREQEAYLREGIETLFARPSNLPCIDLFISKAPPGIVKLLADQCRTVGTEQEKEKAFVSCLNKQFREHSHFTRVDAAMVVRILAAKREKWREKAPKDLSYEHCFQVSHYAAQVTYSAREFVTKSIDALPQHLVDVLCTSCKPGVATLFSQNMEASKATVGEKFVKQLEVLTSKLDKGASLFVRCIKPNACSPPMPRRVDGPLVLEQLVCGGVVAALEMRRIGFPDRMEYRQFCDEFWILELGWRQVAETWQDERAYCEAILERFIGDDTQYALGHSKVFMRNGVLARMRATVSFRTYRFAIVVQRKWRFLKGTQLLHSVEEARNRLEDLEEESMERGLAECGSVATAYKRASEVSVRVCRELQEATERHAPESPRTAKPKMARELVERCGEDIPRLRQLVLEAGEALQRASERRRRAVELLETRLQEARQEAGALLKTLEPCEAECRSASAAANHKAEGEAESSALAACEAACGVARARLDVFLRRELPELQAQGPVGLDLSRDYVAEDPAPRATELLAELGALVGQAEATAATLHTARLSFEDSVADEQQQRIQARERLEALQLSAQWAMDEGLDAVQDALLAAWRLDNEAELALRGSQDREAFERAVAKLAAAVEAAEDVIQRAKEHHTSKRQLPQQQLSPHARQEVPAPSVELLGALSAREAQRDLQCTGGAFLVALGEALRELEERPTAAGTQLTAELRRVQETVHALGISEDHFFSSGSSVGRMPSSVNPSWAGQSWQGPSSFQLGRAQQSGPQWRGACLAPWRRRQ